MGTPAALPAGIPCELRFACWRPITLREGDGGWRDATNCSFWGEWREVATPSRFELPISSLTGRRVRPLHHGAAQSDGGKAKKGMTASPFRLTQMRFCVNRVGDRELTGSVLLEQLAPRCLERICDSFPADESEPEFVVVEVGGYEGPRGYRGAEEHAFQWL